MTEPENRYSSSSTTNLGIAARHMDDKTVIQNSDFEKLYPTGINVELNLPIVKTTDQYIFGVNLDGFIPQFNLAETVSGTPARKNVYRNLFPVQFFDGTWNSTTPIGRITQDIQTMAVQTLFQSHAFVDGAINVVARLTANTAMSGNLQTARLRTATRNYRRSVDANTGLSFSNFLGNITDVSQESFALVDLSLNRTASYQCDRTAAVSATHFAFKLDSIALNSSKIGGQPFIQQFTEDWLLFGLVNTLPATQSNVLTISFFFDYSNVTFEVPLLVSPSFPYNNTGDPGRILDITRSFYNGTTSQPYVWLPLV